MKKTLTLFLGTLLLHPIAAAGSDYCGGWTEAGNTRQSAHPLKEGLNTCSGTIDSSDTRDVYAYRVPLGAIDSWIQGRFCVADIPNDSMTNMYFKIDYVSNAIGSQNYVTDVVLNGECIEFGTFLRAYEDSVLGGTWYFEASVGPATKTDSRTYDLVVGTSCRPTVVC